MRNKKGQFAPGNSFGKGHGAPKGNQNAKGHGAPARNINAVKHGIYLRWEWGEGPEDRLPPGAGSDVLEVLTGAKEFARSLGAGLIPGRTGRREDGPTSLLEIAV